MKKCNLKRAVSSALMAVLMGIVNAVPVNAGLSVEGVNTQIGFDCEMSAGNICVRKSLNGAPVYCIEPSVHRSEEDIYENTDLKDYTDLSEEVKERIAEYSYFGYGYQDHNDDEDYDAAQYLVWVETAPEFVENMHFYDLSDHSVSKDEVILQRAQRILDDVDRFHKSVNFSLNGKEQASSLGPVYAGQGDVGDTFIFHDDNGVVSHMNIFQNDFGDALQKDGDTLTIHLDSTDMAERSVRLLGSTDTIGARTFLLGDANGTYQKLITRGDVTHTAVIRLHTTAGTDFQKTDLQGNQIAGATLRLIDQNTGNVVDSWISENTSHHVTGLETGHTYVFEEGKTPVGYYYASSQSFSPVAGSTVSIQDEPINTLFSKVDENAHLVAAAKFEITDQTDGRTMQFMSEELNQDVGSFLLPDHTYVVKELEAPAGYYQVKEKEFTVPHVKGSEPIQIVMEDHHIEYSVMKKDENGNPVIGASMSLFDVTNGEKTLLLNWKTDGVKKEIGSLLKAGHSYCISEDDVSTKYFLAVDQNFTVSSYDEGPQTINLTDAHIHYELAKVDENGNPVKDARLVVTDITDPYDDDRVVLDWRSTEDPLIVNLFERGHTYRLRETEGPDGYYAAEEKVFQVPEYGDSGTIAITCEDDRIIYKIIKSDLQGNPVVNAELTLYEKDGDKETKIKSFLSKEEPEVIYGLKNDTDYVVKETAAPSGYYPAKDVAFHVNKQGSAVPIEIHMTDQPIQAQIKKTDLNGKRMAGAVLSLFDETSRKEIGTWTSDSEKDIEIGQQLLAGHTYTLKEVSAPQEYYKAEAQTFTVPEEPQDTLIALTMQDAPIHIETQKTDEKGNMLEGAQLGLFQNDTQIVSWTSEEKTFDLSSYLNAGSSYEIRELNAPAGYYLASPVKFTVDETLQKKDIILAMQDLPVKYAVCKQDEKGNRIAGVHLQLSEQNENGTRLIRQWTTSEKDEELNAILEAGKTYAVEETDGINGYQKAMSQTFTVPLQGTDEPVVITMIDETNALNILKTDEKGRPLSGAEMEVLDTKGKSLVSFTTNDDPAGVAKDRMGKEISSYLIGGESYVMHEVKAPFGYELCQDISFTMSGTKEAPQVIAMMDRAKTVFVKVDKRGAEGNMPLLSDCEITVMNKDTGMPAYDLQGESAKALTDETGAVQFELPYTKEGYVVQETKAPEGYAIDSSLKELALDQEEYFHAETPEEIHVVDQKNVDTGTQLPYHAFLALVCALGCALLMLYPHEKA